MFLLLTLNRFYTFFSTSNVDFEQVSAGWVDYQLNIEDGQWHAGQQEDLTQCEKQ